MKAAMMPGFSEMIVVIDPTTAVTRGNMISSIMPWMYAPWPDTMSTGIIHIESNGNTLRDLLLTLGNFYKRINIDFEPVNQNTNDVDSDYTVLVNDKNYAYLPDKLDTVLKADDRVVIKILWRWDG